MALYSTASFPCTWPSAFRFNGWVGRKSAGVIVRVEFFFFFSSVKALGFCLTSSFQFSWCTEAHPPHPPVSISTCLSVWARQWGDTGVGLPARVHRSPVGPVEWRKEYQLKGYEYLRAELFNNIRVGGPRDLQDESCGMINVTRHHERHGRQECRV